MYEDFYREFCSIFKSARIVDAGIVPTISGVGLALKFEFQDGERYTHIFDMEYPVEDMQTLLDVVRVHSRYEVLFERRVPDSATKQPKAKKTKKTTKKEKES